MILLNPFKVLKNRSLFTRVVFTNDKQTVNPIFFKVETYLDRLQVPEIYLIQNFTENDRVFSRFTRVVFTDIQTDRQFDFLQG